MGKASRRKRQGEIDYLARLHDGLCLRCGKRPRPPGGSVWCRPCTAYGQEMRRTRTEAMPTPTRAQWQALYDTLNHDHLDQPDQETP